MTSGSSDIEVALSAAAAGAAVVRAAYGSEVTRYAKSGYDFATNVDVEAERAILDVIAAARPDDARIGEESGSAGGPGSRRWLVDPLCGTVNFVAGTPLVAVNVALLDGAAPSVSVSADPISREMFWSDGTGAAVRRAGVDEPIRPAADSRIVDVDCDGPLDRAFVGPQLLDDPAFRARFGPRVLSTTLAVAWVAAGRRAAYVSDGSLVDNVHFAAGIGLCRVAGCVVADLAGDSLEAGRGLLVSADAATHEQLLDLIRPHLRDLMDGDQPP